MDTKTFYKELHNQLPEGWSALPPGAFDREGEGGVYCCAGKRSTGLYYCGFNKFWVGPIGAASFDDDHPGFPTIQAAITHWELTHGR